ncbi:hypothetical protein Q7P37_005903 [Cladosporium fusiforme]
MQLPVPPRHHASPRQYQRHDLRTIHRDDGNLESHGVNSRLALRSDEESEASIGAIAAISKTRNATLGGPVLSHSLQMG